ncbi:MAG: cadmium-translocating P-type ATPase [Clostridiales bacterium]|nr:cadmium-translocating P-type ATPase [Clostridiales bacterium]
MEKEQKESLVKIIVGAVLFIAVTVLKRIFSGLDGAWLLAAYLVPYLILGYEVIIEAAENIVHGKVFDENFLMTLATVGAFCTGEFPEAVAVMLFYQVGELFQDFAVDRSRESISSLMDVRPDHANIERDGRTTRVSPDEVKIGDTIVIMPGERIPLDAIVTDGESDINTVALTGESLPRDVRPGDDVISGCVNGSGTLRAQVTREYGESTVSKILDLVENASSKKAKAENFITKFARCYTPAVVISAVLLAFIPPIFLGDLTNWIHRALIFLVISCPCALVISVPLSFFGGIGKASKNGILIKGGNYMDVLARSETVVFDKTGTLTKGVFNVTVIHPHEISEERLLEYAAISEAFSNHPIARSIKEAYGKDIDETRLSNVSELAGKGVCAVIDGHTVRTGNDKLMEDEGIVYHPCHHVGTTVHVSVDGVYAGHIVISDELKSDSAEAVKLLRGSGVKKTVMLTGDSESVGADVAKEVGIDEVYTNLLPADKVEKVEKLLNETSEKGSLVFVGDGINDAPVLSRADVGIAMGGMGTDAAIEAADIVLMDDKPSKIALAIEISKRTLSIARQNIVFALIVKGLILLLGALGLANMWMAVFADVGVSVLAILNSMRALTGKAEPSRKSRR